ncbi:hypothetical protein ACFOWM_12520 [Ferruginibacter yonginensis]|uniref:Uncharacterized protein n=1 Tax=Ferruginibacter yonginensis TaxID=1310416 RepID=A0ABV8QV21_9BACT
MLNLVSFDKSDSKRLENSYNALNKKNEILIINEGIEFDTIYSQTIENIKIPNNAIFKFQNLFKLKSESGYFYIAQCLADFGYPPGTKGAQTFQRKYSYQIIGIANIKIDLGITHLRPKTKIDRLINKLLKNYIVLNEQEKFNEKYYLKSNKENEVVKFFDKVFINTIMKYDDVLLRINQKQIYISIAQEFNTNHTRIIQDILSHIKYLQDE